MKEDKGYKIHKGVHRREEKLMQSCSVPWKLCLVRVGFGPM